MARPMRDRARGVARPDQDVLDCGWLGWPRLDAGIVEGWTQFMGLEQKQKSAIVDSLECVRAP